MHAAEAGRHGSAQGMAIAPERRARRSGLPQLARRASHAATARQTCPSLIPKSVTPHTLRHSAAMDLLRRGVEQSVIALWLGHESLETSQIYLHADMQLKERALAHATSSGLVPSRYRPPDPLLTFLEGL